MGIRTWVWNAGVQPGRCHTSQRVKDFMSSYVPPHIFFISCQRLRLDALPWKIHPPPQKLNASFWLLPFHPEINVAQRIDGSLLNPCSLRLSVNPNIESGGARGCAQKTCIKFLRGLSARNDSKLCRAPLVEGETRRKIPTPFFFSRAARAMFFSSMPWDVLGAAHFHTSTTFL